MTITPRSNARQVFQIANERLRENFDWGQCFDEVLRRLRDCPAALLETDDRGRNLLQIACKYDFMSSARSALICTLFEGMPDAVQSINIAASPQLLHDLWWRRLDSADFVPCVRALLQVLPEYATIRDDDDNTLLHAACHYRAPLDVIRRLLDLWPSAAAACNERQETPLHLECDYRGNRSVVRLLLSVFPEAIKQRNDDFMLPLNIAMSRSPHLVDVLFEMDPQLVMEKDRFLGETCLHWACTENLGIYVVQKLLRVRPQAALKPDTRGMLPIHYASFWAPHLVDLLVQAYPNTLAFADNAGRTPLHHAVDTFNKNTLATVRRLIGTNSAMASRPDKGGRSPLVNACEQRSTCSDVDSLSVIYTLLLAAPLQLRLR